MRINLLALTVCLGSLTMAGHAYAHAHLVTADPQPDGTVATAPVQISITYTEKLEAKLSAIRVEDASGAEVDSGDSHLDPQNAKRMIVDLKLLPPGTYTVIWNATATDTHKTNGSYTFKVTGC